MHDANYLVRTTQLSCCCCCCCQNTPIQLSSVWGTTTTTTTTTIISKQGTISSWTAASVSGKVDNGTKGGRQKPTEAVHRWAQTKTGGSGDQEGAAEKGSDDCTTTTTIAGTHSIVCKHIKLMSPRPAPLHCTVTVESIAANYHSFIYTAQTSVQRANEHLSAAPEISCCWSSGCCFAPNSSWLKWGQSWGLGRWSSLKKDHFFTTGFQNCPKLSW